MNKKDAKLLKEISADNEIFSDEEKSEKLDFAILFMLVFTVFFVIFTCFYFKNRYVKKETSILFVTSSVSQKTESKSTSSKNAGSKASKSKTNSEVKKSVQSEDEDIIVNINTADINELCKLKGIGETKALAIIEYRSEFGSFYEIDELLNVKGIGKNILEDIRNNIIL